ncbi:MAG: redoxin family protein [Isosphaeraceae bacterium]|nr:redoxin family protein [Isosphaeraceae bacterium]
MRTLRLPTVLLVLTTFLGPAGCSSTSGLRTGTAPKVRTIAAVGDKTLPAEAGEPGSSVAADEYTPERRVNQDGRVSGRVFDDKGEPVPNARVRLALGGASGGKVVSTTTDKSGAFTLRGLRPGASYTVIAESKDQELGPLRGSAEAQAPETDVKITLSPDEDSMPPARASGNVSRVSRPRAGDDEDQEQFELSPQKPATAPGRNELLPPAPEAESYLPPKEQRQRRPSGSTDTEAPMTARWRRGDMDRPASSARIQDGSAPSTVAPGEESYDDDGLNPLPPALDPGEAESPARTSANLRGTRSKSTRVVAKATPGSSVFVPENFTPISLADKPFAGEPIPGTPGTSLAPNARGSASQAPPVVPWYETPSATEDSERTKVAHEESALVAPDDLSTPQGPRRRARWSEIVAAPQPAHDASGTAAERAQPAPSAEGHARLIVSTDGPARPTTAALAGGTQDGLLAYCRFDAKSRRIVDFRLPDVNGKPVRLQDLDSDLVLIDFWGTWCKPCVNAIPHLVDLQKRFGGKHLTVLGIASEQGPPAARAAAVAKASQQLGINYPVLLSGMDGETCPVQEALHIQAFPTLILVDRQGRILWRDQGATPATLSRLDHLIDVATKTDDTTRRY